MRLPYPGLRPFRRDESDLFFGREGCVDQMVDRLAATRFLAVLGPSGSGKSSLVLTGLLDALEIGLFARAGSRWRIAYTRPGARPIDNLARALVLPTDAESPISNLDIELLSSYLRRGPRSIVEWCTDGNLDAGTNLLILVDQFEELFRYSDYAGREEAEAFVALLSESAQSANATIYVTITMRSEYLGACALVPGLAERINAGLYLVPRMTREQVREAITGPARVCGFAIEPALVNHLLNDLMNLAPWDDDPDSDQLQRLSGRADQLPLMQHVLNRLWLRATEAKDDRPIELRAADYDQAGGLTGALDAHAREVFESIDAADRPLVETVFRALVSGTTIENAVRRPCRFGDLVVLANGDREAVRRIVDAFRRPECNFLTLRDDTVIDISHESLIRQWSALRDWVRREFESAQHYRHIETTAQLWDKGDAGLLTMPFLGVARDWRQRERPTAIWAARYGGDLELALRFLDASAKHHERRRRAAYAAVCCLFLGFLGSLAFAVVQHHNEKTSKNDLAMLIQDLANARSQLQDSNLNLADELVDFGVPAQSTLQWDLGTQTPNKIPRGTAVSTTGLEKIVDSHPQPIFIDALKSAHFLTIPNALRIAFAGQPGDFSDRLQRRLRVRLDNLTDGNLDATLVFFCVGAECWESYNASLRAINAGYTHVYWYRGGLSSWRAAKNLHTRDIEGEVQDLKKKLSASDNPKRRWVLAVALSEAGEIMLDLSPAYFDSAIDAEKRGRDELRSLMRSFPDNVDFLSDVAAENMRLASAYEQRKMPDLATAAYGEVSAVQRELAVLAEKQSGSGTRLSDISDAESEIGDDFYRHDKPQEALDAHLAAEAIDQNLVSKFADNSSYQEKLARDERQIGEVLDAQKQYDQAIDRFQKSLSISQGLSDKEQVGSQIWHDISVTHLDMGDTLTEVKKFEEALKEYRDAIETAKVAADNSATGWQAKNDMRMSGRRIGALAYQLVLAKEYDKALEAADFAISLSLPPDAAWMRMHRAHALMFLGRVDEAREIYLRFRGFSIQRERLWEDYVRNQFADLRDHGLSHPLMGEIEKIFRTS
jgi:tetratricopeptide (TPR) repeat protein